MNQTDFGGNSTPFSQLNDDAGEQVRGADQPAEQLLRSFQKAEDVFGYDRAPQNTKIFQNKGEGEGPE